MSDIDTGLFLGGVARQRNANRQLEISERQVAATEAQTALRQRIQRRTEIMDAITKTSDQAASLIGGVTTRDQPGFAETLGTLRSNVETLARQGEEAGILPAAEALSVFDNAVLTAQTAGERATVEGQSAVVGAQSTARSIQAVPSDQRDLVLRSLNMSAPQANSFIQLLDEVDRAVPGTQRHELALGRARQLASAAGDFVQVTTDADGNVTVTQGTGAIPSRMTLNAGQLDNLRANLGTIDQSIQIVDSLLANPPALGVLGTGRRVGETLGGVFEDVTKIPANELAGDILSSLSGEERDLVASTGELAAFQTILTFAVARSLQPSGRLLKDTVDQARELVQLTGFRSEEQVVDRLEVIRQRLDAGRTGIQQRLQQGVQGSTDIPSPTVSSPVPTAEDLLRQLNELTGGGGG